MGSKLEIYVDILNVLAESGPLKVSNIAVETKANINTLKVYLEFLIKQGLIEERTIGKRNKVYSNTFCGTSVVTFFTEIKKTLTFIGNNETIL